jgi:5-methyltetrahydropteroyltriglutamate--homocysteine methyltransferase
MSSAPWEPARNGRRARSAELDRCAARQVSIEAAQPRLDLSEMDALPSKTIVLGVLDLGLATAETPLVVAARIGQALRHVPESRLVIAPDCGMKYLPRDLAFAKLRAMVEGARLAAPRRPSPRRRSRR